MAVLNVEPVAEAAARRSDQTDAGTVAGYGAVRTEGLAGDELTQRSLRSQPPVLPPRPREPMQDPEGPGRGRCASGTISYMPPLFGMMRAWAVILDLLGELASAARGRP